jgi:LPS-assembly protein
MKNNFILTFAVFITFFNLYASTFADEFNFNVTEIQIYEDGNLIKGVKGGTVTTENNIIIIADNFEYNKSTTLFKAMGNAKLIDQNENITIESNEVYYLKNKEKIYTLGKSKADNGLNIKIDADEYFRYNKLTSILEAKGNVVIVNKQKDVIINTNEVFYEKNLNKFFTVGKTKSYVDKKYTINTSDLIFLEKKMLLSSIKKTTLNDDLNNFYTLDEFEYQVDKEILKGKGIEVLTTTNKPKNSDKYIFETGFFDFKNYKFSGKDVEIIFHKEMYDDIENDPRLKGVVGKSNEYSTILDNAVFTTCKKTDKCPPWKITSKKIKHDKIKKQIIYKDAWLEIYDFPVIYFPKFFHPDPSVARQSGFLKPELGSSQNLGSSIYSPYFYVISKDKDITIKPRFFENNKFILQNEYRQKTKNSFTIADFSFTKGHDSSSTDKGDTRSHFFTNTLIDLTLENYISSMLEINYQKASNDNYLKLFDLSSPLLLDNHDSLESIIKLDLEHQDYDLTTAFEVYETLSGSNTDRYQYVLPSYNFSKNFFLENFKGSFFFSSYGDNTLKDTNVTSTTLFNNLNYTADDMFFENGIKSNYEILFKNINSIGKNDIKYKNSPQSELMSAYIYNATLPLKKNKKNITNTLTPKISLRLSPHEMKNNTSTSRRMDVGNIFISDRLGLGNSFESGESITLGLDFSKEKTIIKNNIAQIEKYFDFKLSSVFRLSEEKNLPTNSTLNKKQSNIFGKLNYKPIENILLNYDFSLTSNFNNIEYSSLLAHFNFGDFSTQFDYLEEQGVMGEKHVIENTTEYNFNESNSLSFSTRRDRKLDLTEYYDLVYEYKNDCLVAGVKYKKNYYNDADIKPVEELFFSITIIPFATFSPDKMILNKDRVD